MIGSVSTQSATISDDDRLTTEAEALCLALVDMGIALAYDVDDDRLYMTIVEGQQPDAGAFSLFRLVADRAWLRPDFCEDVVAAVALLGSFVAEAPAVDVELETASAERVIQELARAGLLIRCHYEADDELGPMLSFMPVPGAEILPTAHMLMRLVVDRFQEEPDFARVAADYVAAGLPQHGAQVAA